MIEKDVNDFKVQNIKITYRNNETKYYLLTTGSGYPLAEFLPGMTECTGGFVVPEHRFKTSNPW